jgi:hypothetical protein
MAEWRRSARYLRRNREGSRAVMFTVEAHFQSIMLSAFMGVQLLRYAVKSRASFSNFLRNQRLIWAIKPRVS